MPEAEPRPDLPRYLVLQSDGSYTGHNTLVAAAVYASNHDGRVYEPLAATTAERVHVESTDDTLALAAALRQKDLAFGVYALFATRDPTYGGEICWSNTSDLLGRTQLPAPLFDLLSTGTWRPDDRREIYYATAEAAYRALDDAVSEFKAAHGIA